MKKIVSTLLLLVVCAVPVFASEHYFTYSLPAFSGWGEIYIGKNVSGPNAYMRLSKYGTSVDTVEFVYVNDYGNEITSRATATEGAISSSRVIFKDGGGTRYVRGAALRSNHWNISSYSVNGYILY